MSVYVHRSVPSFSFMGDGITHLVILLFHHLFFMQFQQKNTRLVLKQTQIQFRTKQFFMRSCERILYGITLWSEVFRLIVVWSQKTKRIHIIFTWYMIEKPDEFTEWKMS